MADNLHALPSGHRLHEYRIDKVLGSGGFGITYYAWDENLDKPVAIKEYLPNDFAARADTTTVRPRSTSDAENYQWGLERFLDEARTLARFRHPHLNEVYRFFEANGTAYMVLEYIEGETLSALLRREPRLEENRLRRLLNELLSGLEEVHKAGFVHRDMTPGNIILRADGSAVLLDFGASRQLVGQRSRSITSVLTPGYAPIEQYAGQVDDVGPWSDLYALGMVAYRCISGLGENELPDAISRARLARKGERDLKPAVEVGRGRYAEDLLKAVDWSIKVNEDDRPQSVTALREALDGRDASRKGKAPDRKKEKAPTRNISSAASRFRRWNRRIVVGLMAVAGLAAGGWFLVDDEEARLQLETERILFSSVFGRDPLPRFKGDTNGWTDLHTAAAMNAVALARFLVESGANMDARLKNDGEELTDDLKNRLRDLTGGETFDRWHRNGAAPLHVAAVFNAREVAEYLVEAGADVNAQERFGVTPLLLAAFQNAREVAEYLVTAGADVNAEDDLFGQTPLHNAAKENAREVAEYLVEAGADVNAKDGFGRTPLHNAAQENAREMAEYLVAAGADVNAKGGFGLTPLHHAAEENAREVAEYLVEAGADVNAKGYVLGQTPLHDAVEENAREVVEYLVAAGADVNAKDRLGGTPLDLAVQREATETAEFLRSRGAR